MLFTCANLLKYVFMDYAQVPVQTLVIPRISVERYVILDRLPVLLVAIKVGYSLRQSLHLWNEI